jgi:hypothetical protein
LFCASNCSTDPCRVAAVALFQRVKQRRAGDCRSQNLKWAHTATKFIVLKQNREGVNDSASAQGLRFTS